MVKVNVVFALVKITYVLAKLAIGWVGLGVSPAEAQNQVYTLRYDLTQDPHIFALRFKGVVDNLKADHAPSLDNWDPSQALDRIIRRDIPADMQAEAHLRDGYFLLNFVQERRAEWLNRPVVAQVANQPRGGGYYCRFCDNGSKHMRWHCPRRPALGACYDCLSKEHKKGHPDCPGRTSAGSPGQGQGSN